MPTDKQIQKAIENMADNWDFKMNVIRQYKIRVDSYYGYANDAEVDRLIEDHGEKEN